VLSRRDLLHVRTEALRLNVWFKALSRTERAVINLTVKCVGRIRSQTLEEIVLGIIRKIPKALECSFLMKAEEVGGEIAGEVCKIAQKWGNKEASDWKHDKAFARFLGVCTINTSQKNQCLIRGIGA
jgi:hypothetical protein